MALVEVRPVKKPVWFRNEEARALIKPIKIGCAVDSRTRKYVFPASEEERKELESILGISLDLNFKNKEEHPFFDTELSHVQLSYGANYFDTSNPMDLVKLYILKGSDLIANSLEDLEKGICPKAKFVIIDANEDEEVKASKQALKTKAMVEMVSLTLDRKIDIVKILSGLDVSKQSANVVDLKIVEAINKDVEAFFNVLKKDNKDTTTEALILNLIDSRVLSKEGTIIKYGDVILGADMPNAIKFLNSPKNQTLKVQLQEKL
nr:MAG TPA: hypothetical protein [Bacteriophage sp.]